MSNDTFQWTDERVLAFVNFTYRNNANLLLEKDLEAFKQSKMPKKSAMYYHTPPYPEKEWEIVSYMPPSNHPIPATNTLVDLYDFQIHSVRRLSDNEVFTAGDVFYFNDYADGDVCFTISGFYNRTEANQMMVTNKVGNHYNIMAIKKVSSPEQPKKERIEVDVFGASWVSDKAEKMIVALKNGETFDPVKLPALKAAIERVLNDDGGTTVKEGDDIYIRQAVDNDWNLTGEVKFFVGGNPMYTQDQLKEAEEKAFNAAREPYCETAMGQRPKYWTFQDYLNHQRDKK